MNARTTAGLALLTVGLTWLYRRHIRTGNDGLTDHQRAQHARHWREGVGSKATAAEMAHLRALTARHRRTITLPPVP